MNNGMHSDMGLPLLYTYHFATPKSIFPLLEHEKIVQVWYTWRENDALIAPANEESLNRNLKSWLL